jgi:hypothetical protein
LIYYLEASPTYLPLVDPFLRLSTGLHSILLHQILRDE